MLPMKGGDLDGGDGLIVFRMLPRVHLHLRGTIFLDKRQRSGKASLLSAEIP